MRDRTVIRCTQCGNYVHSSSQKPKFCSECGRQFDHADMRSRIGVVRDVKRVRVTFGATEIEVFRQEINLDLIMAQLRDSMQVEDLEDLRPRDQFPYLCGYCTERVSATNDGVCDCCESELWLERNEETEARRWSIFDAEQHDNCPECGKQVFDTMPYCPHCHCDFHTILAEREEAEEHGCPGNCGCNGYCGNACHCQGHED